MHSNLNGHPALQQAVRRLEQLKPDQFELYFLKKTATRVECKNQQVESLTRAEDVGLAIRLVKDRRLGFSFTTSLEKDAVSRAAETAAEIARFMPEDEFVELFTFGSSVYPDVDTLDQTGLNAPLEQKIALAMQLETVCKKADQRIQTVRKAALSETAYEVHMVDSGGDLISHHGSLFSANIACKAEQDGEGQMGGDFTFSNYLDSLTIEETGKRAAENATELLGAKQAPTMKCPAVFRNSVIADLIDFVSGSFSAEEIDKGRSMLAGKQGERLFSEKVTLIDDGLLPGGYSTAPFDGEGVPSRKTVLVDGGLVTASLYDNYYARKFGTESTASAVRGIKGPPSIGTSNLYLPAGKKSFNSLLDGITKGIFITELMGIHTANPVTGDFSVGASGILIEGGKLTRPVRGFAVAGNVLELFRNMTDTGNDLRFFGSVGAPSVRVSELSVGGT